MWHVALFWILMASSTVYALRFGGEPERLVAAIVILGVFATFAVVAPIADRNKTIELGPLTVDLIVCVALLSIAMRSRRYWPMWMAIFQCMQVASHLEPLLPGGGVRTLYGFVLSIWIFLMCPLLAIGTLRHRIRLAAAMDEDPWTTLL
jgi:hypothetical protein